MTIDVAKPLLIGNELPIVSLYSPSCDSFEKLTMGNNRKQARRAVRQVLKSKLRILGDEIDTIIFDKVAAAHARLPKRKRDSSPIEARNEAQTHYLISLDTK